MNELLSDLIARLLAKLADIVTRAVLVIMQGTGV